MQHKLGSHGTNFTESSYLLENVTMRFDGYLHDGASQSNLPIFIGEEIKQNVPQTVRALSRYQTVSKRLFDVFFALTLIIFLLPAFTTIAILVKLTSKGPILFRQPRIGYLNKLFICLKFRSMYHANEDLLCETQVDVSDIRVTPVGRWLRRLSLDELPQLFNVLLGSMSLVGPRPHAPATKAGNVLFHLAIDNYASRHSVLPGITGLAQVRGFRGRTATVEDIRQRVELDLYYIQHWSLVLDLRILAGTLVHLATSGEVV